MHDKVVNKYIQIFCDGCVLKNPVKTWTRAQKNWPGPPLNTKIDLQKSG
jgi:hypothetical protein